MRGLPRSSSYVIPCRLHLLGRSRGARVNARSGVRLRIGSWAWDKRPSGSGNGCCLTALGRARLERGDQTTGSFQ